MDGGGGGSSLWSSWNTCTMGVIVLIFTCQLVRWSRTRFRSCSSLWWLWVLPTKTTRVSDLRSSSLTLAQPSPRTISTIISDSDLKHLLEDLNCEKLHEDEKWEDLIDRTNKHFSYTAKCYKLKDGPLKYLSATVFENCSPELLRDFYMDNNYRKLWDKTVIEHEQLQLDESTGTEIGRLVKKFPFVTLREYVLAWRMWQDSEGAFYCLSKGCEHPFAPKQKKYVRVAFFRSGWRIRKAGQNACEIKMVHQEDAGLNAELGKLAFTKGIWSYVCKMDNALRRYTPPTPSVLGGLTIQKFPPGLDPFEDIMYTAQRGMSMSSSTICRQGASDCGMRKAAKMPSKKLIKNGLILLGGAICLSRGHSSLGAKLAMAYILTRLTKHGSLSRQNRPA